jgi:hypothetical protein
MNCNFAVAAGLALLASGTPVLGADEKPKPPCAADTMHQFDFWIGRWIVTEKGKAAGSSHIEQTLGGCALLENWTGAGGGEGKSLNFFDRADGLWHQTWIDRDGGALFLSGKFENGAMRLQGERPATAKQPALRHRITWTALPGGKVRQLWESSPPEKDEWTVQFDGIYQPAN